MQSHNYSYEIFLDDGRKDNSWLIEGFAQQNPNVKGVRFKKMENRRPCMLVLLMITLDADLQDSPEEILFVHMIATESTIWFRVGKRNVTILLLLKICLLNYLIGPENIWCGIE
jgi:hypothetical protein